MNVALPFRRKFSRSLLLLLAGWGMAVVYTVAATTWPPAAPKTPYARSNDSTGNSTAVDKPVPGYIGPEGNGVAPYDLGGGLILNNDQYVNPAFVGWATSVVDYSPARPDLIESDWLNPAVAIGPASADVFDVTSLGDLTAADITVKTPPGSITLGFATAISDGPGPDFAVFGNAFNLNGAVTVFAKLAFVEVSSNGTDFARFPCVDTNTKPAGTTWSYVVSDPTKIYNFFGKADNAYGQSWGVPFDLAVLTNHPLVVAGKVDLQHIRYVRLVAVVGNGSTKDTYNHVVYDPWPTQGSPGPEVQAVGVLHAPPSFFTWVAAISNIALRGVDDNPAGDGVPNLMAYALGATAGQAVPITMRPKMTLDASGRPTLTFPSSTATDLNLIVEAATVLNADTVWTPIAQSAGGSAWTVLTDISGQALSVITINSASHTVSVATLTPPAPGTAKFLRLRVTQANP